MCMTFEGGGLISKKAIKFASSYTILAGISCLTILQKMHSSIIKIVSHDILKKHEKISTQKSDFK
jgi:hypothetical protein